MNACRLTLPAPARPPRPTAMAVRRGRVVVGVSFDRASALALRRAHALALALGLDLRVVHVASVESCDGAGFAGASMSRAARARGAKGAVRRWALVDLGIDLPPRSVRVPFGDPAEQLRKEAARARSELLVVGGRSDARDSAPGELVHALVADSACPVLVSSPSGDGKSMMVATDLDSPRLPVVRAAARMARRLGRLLTVVHNVDGASASPQPRRVEQAMTHRLETLGEVVRAIDHVEDATVTREATAVDGILQVARTRDVDMVVVGVRRGLGLTSRSILAEARRSVLTVPL
jgi:nucleotide-binding universal stress UspA family protein